MPPRDTPVAEPIPRRARRADPGRRDAIIDVALDVIAEHGVAGTSARRVAEAADVPLGSISYHFDGMDELFREAFTRFGVDWSRRFAERFRGVVRRDEALDVVVALIEHPIDPSARSLVITHELYTLAARRTEFRAITNAWMARDRATVDAVLDPVTSHLVNALIEGLTLQAALDIEPLDSAVVAEGVRRIAG